MLNQRAGVSQAEWNAFLAAEARVTTYISTWVDPAGWFRDCPLTLEDKLVVDSPQLAQFQDLAKAIKRGLNGWRGAQATMEQRGVMDTLTAVAFGISGLDEEPEETRQQVRAILDGAVVAIGEVTKIGVGMSPIGDFIDICELVTGREMCNPFGAELGMGGRIAAGIGVVIGSGAFWRFAAGAVRNRRVGERIADLAKRFSDIPLPEVKALRKQLGPVALAHLDITGREIQMLVADLGPKLVSGLAPKVGGKGLLELRQLRFFTIKDPARAAASVSNGAAVKALGSMRGKSASEIHDSLRAQGMVRKPNMGTMEFWVHPTDGSLVRIETGALPGRLPPYPNFKKEISLDPGSTAADRVACKVTDDGAITPAFTNEARGSMKEWFERTMKTHDTDMDQFPFRPAQEWELDDLMDVWGEATHPRLGMLKWIPRYETVPRVFAEAA